MEHTNALPNPSSSPWHCAQVRKHFPPFPPHCQNEIKPGISTHTSCSYQTVILKHYLYFLATSTSWPGRAGQSQAGQSVTKLSPAPSSDTCSSSFPLLFPKKGLCKGSLSTQPQGEQDFIHGQLSSVSASLSASSAGAAQHPAHTKPTSPRKFFLYLLPSNTPEFRQLMPPQSYR